MVSDGCGKEEELPSFVFVPVVDWRISFKLTKSALHLQEGASNQRRRKVPKLLQARRGLEPHAMKSTESHSGFGRARVFGCGEYDHNENESRGIEFVFGLALGRWWYGFTCDAVKWLQAAYPIGV